MPADPTLEYDEFSFFEENAREVGLTWDGPPTVRRCEQALPDGRALSALVWGDAEPELVLLHGGAQNAHTWDTVALALRRPLVALDLPGHGHSDGATAGAAGVAAMADDVAAAVRALAPRRRAVVGMSLGGLTAIALAQRHPDLVPRLALIDITPGVDSAKSRDIVAFIDGPPTFADFEELLRRTIEFNPTRSVSSLRRGILHNAVQQADGTWVWRWARHRTPAAGPVDHGNLWDAVTDLRIPLLLVRGMRPSSVVDDADEAELLRRRPDAHVEHVAEAGHSVQGDAPLELAAILDRFVP